MRFMDAQQERFMRDEIFSLTLMATVQRAHVYASDGDADAKWRFQKALRQSLQQLEPSYRETVTEEDHMRNVVALSAKLSLDHADILAGRRFRIGTAQKALNLYLKYLWCLGKLPVPPHCPFDYRVIAKLSEYFGPSWTKLDDLKDYVGLVVAAKAKAGSMSLAEWELRTYNDAFDQ
jgi:hypothetical protein